MSVSAELRDRARGAIVGLACGDALGAPVEFVSREVIAQLYPSGFREFISGGWMDVEPGELTDDSRMMLDLAETLVMPGQVDLNELGRRFVAWADERPKDIGNTTSLAIDLLRSGVPWTEAGQRTLVNRGADGAASNGSVMRCAPVAVRFHNQPDLMCEISIDTSRITHAESRCTWSCVAINQAIANLLRKGTLGGLIDATVAGNENETVVSAIRNVPALSQDELNGSGYVLNAVQIALWAVLNTPNFEEAVVAAVLVGDDTDTNAAVTGAVAGALYGYTGITERWRTQVQQHDRLVALADRLIELAE